MTHSSFDRMLAASGKTTLEDDAGARESLLAIARQAQRENHRPRRHFSRLLPVFAVGGLAVTGAAAVWLTSVQPDVVVPIAFTTDAGRSVECVIHFEVPDPAIRAYLVDTDWDGVGQRIYDRALAASLVPRDDDLTFDSVQERESWSWFEAADDFTLNTIPAGLIPENDVVAASDSSCAGDLH